MPWKPSVEGELPTLGYEAIDWITDCLAAPDRVDYEPFVLYREQEEFLLEWYRIDENGRRVYTRGVLSRPRGWGKSPILAAVSCLEAIGPCVFDGWDADGQPVAKPWSEIRTPLVQVAAVSEGQTRNTWGPLLEMLREEAPVHDYLPGMNVLETFVSLPRGRIEKVASSSRTLKGARALFTVLDQTEEWVETNGGHTLAEVIRANAAKVGGTTLESPNAFMPGEDSVAERSAAFAEAIRNGQAVDESLLYEHREAPTSIDIDVRDRLREGLRYVYGDASAHEGGCVIHVPPCAPGHMDLERLMSTIYDPAQNIQRSRSDFLNQITHHSDAWVHEPDWVACYRPERIMADGDKITLGFDGSAGRGRGKADATALIGCRISDGHMFTVRVWEQPYGPDGKGWTPPTFEVETMVKECFDRFNVVGFYADPNRWTEHISKWEAQFGRRLRLHGVSKAHPIMLWPKGKTAQVTEFVERTRVAIVTSGAMWAAGGVGELSHDGSAPLTRHVLNARMRKKPTGYLIEKAYPESWDKIDAAYAGILAWKGRLDALAIGITDRKIRRGVTL